MSGLDSCSPIHTIVQIVHNFLFEIENYGFVPNGGRIYYLERTQPPVLSEMVLAVFNATKNETFLRYVLVQHGVLV